MICIRWLRGILNNCEERFFRESCLRFTEDVHILETGKVQRYKRGFLASYILNYDSAIPDEDIFNLY